MTVTSQGQTERTIGKWDEAIADAKRKIRELRMTIKVYQESKKAGDRWPGPDASVPNAR